MENKNKIRNFYSAFTFYSKDIRQQVEEEYLSTNTEGNLDKDVINKIIGNRWKEEPYNIKHMYEMFSVLDKIRFLNESHKEIKYPYSMIENETDYCKKEELVNKICHFKMLFGNPGQPLSEDAKYIIYYNLNIAEYKEKNKQDSLDNICKKMYDDFEELSDYDFNKMVMNSNFNLKNATYEIIDETAMKYIPSRMVDNLQTNEDVDNQPMKRKHDNEENEIENKCIKRSNDCNLYGIF